MKYGKLKVADGVEGKVRDLHKCICDCGSIVYVKLNSLRSGNTKSCGCIKKEDMSVRFSKHNKKGTAEYNAWINMRSRCNNPNNPNYVDYGGRGIAVCDEWCDFLVFLNDMGKKPTKDHTVDRLDNDKGYSKGNCEWKTRKDQSRNRRITIKYTIEGNEKPLAEWCEIYDVDYMFTYRRIRDGWDVKSALTTKKKGE